MKNVFLVIFFFLFLTFDSSAQCAMCRATVGSNLSEGRGVIGTGINFGILYLLAAPYLLVGALVFLWFRTGKKELKERLALQNRMDEIYNNKL